ncbi:MAG: cyclase family protein [Candidatus Brocadiaceae bacterium]|nr:cyclase family protein [Candidatus Brocadiaceae bacterium]
MKIVLQAFIVGVSFLFTGHGLWGGILEEVMKGKATVIDLTYPLNEKNAYWPIGSYAPFQYEVIATIKKDQVFSGKYSTPEHLGTHLDAPNHFEINQPSVDNISFEELVGPAVVLDISSKTEQNPDYSLTRSDIVHWEEVNGKISRGDIVFLYTGWDKRWHDFDAYKNMDKSSRMHFPGYSKEAASFLVKERHIKGIGIDTLSGDNGICSDFHVHHIINGAGKYILENVANLDRLPPRGATVILAPIKIEGGSGGQCRIWAILTE